MSRLPSYCAADFVSVTIGDNPATVDNNNDINDICDQSMIDINVSYPSYGHTPVSD